MKLSAEVEVRLGKVSSEVLDWSLLKCKRGQMIVFLGLSCNLISPASKVLCVAGSGAEGQGGKAGRHRLPKNRIPRGRVQALA